MDRIAIVRELILRRRSDFLEYFEGTPDVTRARDFLAWVETGDPQLRPREEDLLGILPDLDDDGEAHYAVNTGLMIHCLMSLPEREEAYDEAVRYFFEIADSKAHDALYESGVLHPDERLVAAHPEYEREQSWFNQVVGSFSGPAQQS